MSDVLYRGRRFRVRNAIDDGMCEGLTIEVYASGRSAHVVCVIERFMSMRGARQALRGDNGTEFLVEAYSDSPQPKGMVICYFQPGKPDQNAQLKRFNRRY